MRITSIEITNFRQYKSLSFEFSKTTNHDLHIIVADNGVGKTNILNAITWCLYGDEPHLGNESKSLPRLNLKAKNEAVQRGDTSEIVSVKITAEDAGDVIVFARKMNVRVDTDFEQKSEMVVTVNSTGDAKVIAGDDAEGYVERYMPKKIRQYFYFDGEQLDSYFISDESSKIRETIHAISQVDIVSSIKSRLEKIILSKQSEAGKKAPDIKAINDEIIEIMNEIEPIKSEIEELDRQIDISETIIKTNTERLSGQENLPELESRYQLLQGTKVTLEEQLEECMEEIFVFIREMKIALSMYNCAKATYDLITDKEAQNALPPNIDRSLLLQLIDEKQANCFVCNQPFKEESRLYVQSILDKIQVSSETSNILMSIKNELERIITAAENYPKRKKSILKKYKEIDEKLKECELSLQAVDDEIRKFDDKQKVIEWHNVRQTHDTLLKDNIKKRTVAEVQLENACGRLSTAQTKMTKALEKGHECKRINKLIAFATKAKKIVASIETEMMSEVRGKMERRTMEYYSTLIWKKGVYDKIVLDEKYQLDLLHRDGYSCVGSCSAAERSLLALSFTLGLHEVSGFNSLLFIDTPVARVTGQNRINFANVLQEVSKTKQLIMAFTPDEYSENVRNIFAPINSTSFRLSMDTDNEITNYE